MKVSPALDRFLIVLGDHASIGDDGDIGELVGLLERINHRQHGFGFTLVAFKCVYCQRKSGRIGEESDSYLRLQAPFLGVMPTA